MAPRAGNWERVPLIPQSRHAAATEMDAAPAAPPPVPAPPVYSSLLHEWRVHGRALPGVPDHEWDALVSRPVWPGG
ncbi:hypothetical protein C6N75_29795 [Streptomyces solincola]|uniref:Uncharacterized protein n=1 Tax=Streptomyces solincola TaxID=2100817 RepID=A0A2S9PMN7_9ACTN|nr:hypothetical protein [Streptomyces solincola]PRH75657.1 hypothetical protein C6N75_29795 [Streptomyces solincola]